MEVELDFANFWTFRDGLIVKFRAYQTLEEALEESGLSDPASAPGTGPAAG